MQKENVCKDHILSWKGMMLSVVALQKWANWAVWISPENHMN